MVQVKLKRLEAKSRMIIWPYEELRFWFLVVLRFICLLSSIGSHWSVPASFA